MFCNECGSVLNDGAKFCPLCGKPAPAAAVAPQVPAETPVADDITAVMPAIDGSADVTAEMPAAPPAYPPAYAPPAAYPPADNVPAYARPVPARTRSAAPIIIAIVLVVLLVMGGGTLLLLRSGILGGGTGAKVDEGTSVDTGTSDSGDSADSGTTDGTNTDGGVVVGNDTPPTGDPVDITPEGSALSASSTLEGYPASQLVDRKLDTCWAEGVSGHGGGESFSANLGAEMWLVEIQIVPGYLKFDSANSVDRWYSNGRVTRAKLVFSDGSESKAFDLDPDSKDWQIVKLPKAVKTSSVKVAILGTAAATTGTDHDAEDTSVSEIKLLGFPISQ